LADNILAIEIQYLYLEDAIGTKFFFRVSNAAAVIEINTVRRRMLTLKLQTRV
jgi:hypothetical protein